MDNTTTLPEGTIQIRIGAFSENLCVVRSAVQKNCVIMGMPEADIDGVTLALEEALTNIIRHGYGGPCPKPIQIEMSRKSGTSSKPAMLEIVIRDFGRQVDPSQIKSRDLDDVRPGGLGVHIIQSVMDDVDYRCMDDGGMRLRLVKHFDPEPAEHVCNKLKSAKTSSKQVKE